MMFFRRKPSLLSVAKRLRRRHPIAAMALGRIVLERALRHACVSRHLPVCKISSLQAYTATARHHELLERSAFRAIRRVQRVGNRAAHGFMVGSKTAHECLKDIQEICALLADDVSRKGGTA